MRSEMSNECDIIDRENRESRCGCPAHRGKGWPKYENGPRWNATICDVGQGELVAECKLCGAAWVWGEVCATEVHP